MHLLTLSCSALQRGLLETGPRGSHWGSGPGVEGAALELGFSQTHWADLYVGNADAAHAQLGKCTVSFRQQTVNGQ